MQVWSLSSGSSGNCYLVREGDSLLVLEAGLNARRVQDELSHLNLSHLPVVGIVASHEHVDHWLAAPILARRLRAPLICSGGTWQLSPASTNRFLHREIEVGASLDMGTMTVEAFPLPHDALQPMGFLVHSRTATLCLATDMGTATDAIVQCGMQADLVILEANHDVGMLMRGPYPASLKRRILSDVGHLSNEDAGRTIIRMASGRPARFWLAHLSGSNNSPHVALSSVKRVLCSEGLDNISVQVALRGRPSLFWDSQAALQQLRLFSPPNN